MHFVSIMYLRNYFTIVKVNNTIWFTLRTICKKNVAFAEEKLISPVKKKSLR